MWAQRSQRILMAVMLILSLYLLSIDSIYGVILQVFVIIMILIWAISDFCPSLWVFSKVFKNCKKKCEEVK